MSFFQKLSSIFNDEEKIDGNCLLALDIGTSSVKAVIFRVEPDKEGRNYRSIIIGSGKSFFSGKKEAGGNFKEIVRTCNEARKEAQNMAGVTAKEVVVSMTGQFIKGCADSEIYKRDEPEKPIDLSEIKNIIQKLEWKIFEKIRKKELSECGLPEIETKILSGKIIGIKIDGYKVADPVGFQGEMVSLNIFNAYCSSSSLKFFERLGKELDINIVSLVCQPYAVLESIATKFFKSIDFDAVSCIFVDFGGRVTDISVANQGFFTGPKSISVGGDSFTRRLALKLNLSNREAEDIKLKYSNGQLSPQIKRKVTSIIDPDFKVWLRGIETILGDFAAIGNFFLQIFFVGGSSVLPGFKKYIETSEWKNALNLTNLDKVRAISAADISEVEDKTGLLNGPEDIACLALASFGISLIKKPSVINSVLYKVIRLMQS